MRADPVTRTSPGRPAGQPARRPVGRSGGLLADVPAALGAELLKARRSLVPAVSAGAFVAAGLVVTLFGFVLQDPARARALGVLGAKAQLSGGSADWTGHLALTAQVAATGGGVLFGLVTVWLFGREFADGTQKDLLAVPTSRSATVLAKLLLGALWCCGLVVLLLAVSFAGGAWLRLPGWSADVVVPGTGTVLMCGALTVCLTGLYALAASLGRGYLPGVAVLVGVVVLSQVLAVLGYGAAFPPAVPALLSGAAGPDHGAGTGAVLGVLVTGAASAVAVAWWWERADHAR